MSLIVLSTYLVMPYSLSHCKQSGKLCQGLAFDRACRFPMVGVVLLAQIRNVCFDSTMTKSSPLLYWRLRECEAILAKKLVLTFAKGYHVPIFNSR